MATKRTTPLQRKYLALLQNGNTVCIAGINWGHYRTLRALVANHGLHYTLCGNTWLRLGNPADMNTAPSLCYTATTAPNWGNPAIPETWEGLESHTVTLPTFDEYTAS